MIRQRIEVVDIVTRVDRALRQLEDYLHPLTTWGMVHAGPLQSRPVAYFCAEFGIHESIPIYSGGLGILAGDHLKGASDLGVPLVGVGLLYHQGYTTQRLDASYWQHDLRSGSKRPTCPWTPPGARTASRCGWAWNCPGAPLGQGPEAKVGRIRLILLDTRDEANSEEDQALAAVLYGGDQRMRIQQELLLGVGGSRALRALGITPSVYHLNEGHSAFAILERARHRVQEDGLDPWEAMREAASGTVFTTHTPVEAGHDRFPADLAAEHLRPLADGLHLGLQDVLGLGGSTRATRAPFPAHRAGPEALPPGQRRLGAPRRRDPSCGDASGRTAQPTKCPSATSPTASTCPPGSPRSWTTCSRPTWASTGCDGSPPRPVDRGGGHRPGGDLGDQEGAQGGMIRMVRERIAEMRDRSGLPAPGPAAPHPRRPHHRLRPALRDLQAPGPPLHGPGPPRPARQPPRPAREPDLRGPLPPRGRPRQGHHPGRGPPGRGQAVPEPDRLRGEPQHPHRTLPLPGGGRLAQHAPAPHGEPAAPAA